MENTKAKTRVNFHVLQYNITSYLKTDDKNYRTNERILTALTRKHNNIHWPYVKATAAAASPAGVRCCPARRGGGGRRGAGGGGGGAWRRRRGGGGGGAARC